MARPSSKHPTQRELEILKVLWREGPLPVRGVRDALGPAGRPAYTSVMTIMNIMVAKGYLRRRKEGPSYVYRPTASEKATKGRMLGDLVDRAFDGSAAAVMVNLLGSANLDRSEIDELRKLLQQQSEGRQQ